MKKLKITGLAIYETKGAPGVHKEKLRLEADRGIEGDMYARGGDRQLTIADTRLETCSEELVIGKLCGRKFKANILADNILDSDIRAGDVFKAGGAVIEISPAQKECFPDSCEIAAAEIYIGDCFEKRENTEAVIREKKDIQGTEIQPLKKKTCS